MNFIVVHTSHLTISEDKVTDINYSEKTQINHVFSLWLQDSLLQLTIDQYSTVGSLNS